MVLVDSCGWIEYLTEGSLVDVYAPILEDTSNVLIPTVVLYEVAKWVRREGGEALVFEVVARMSEGCVHPLDSRVALLAAELSANHALPMADAIIYAHAQAEGITVVTSDSHFQGLPDVVFHPQPNPP